MSRTNILEVVNLQDLKSIMMSHVTVVLGLTIASTSTADKIMIRKFLKRKAERLPLVTFVYMEVQDGDRGTINVLKGDNATYPKMYHIRGGNNILVSVDAMNQESMYESFSEAEPHYIEEMKNIAIGKNKKTRIDFYIGYTEE